MKLTDHFTSEELGLARIHEPYIIHKAEIVINMCALVYRVLEPLRTKLNEPIIITSGYRTTEQNKKVGGAEYSQHLKGEAVDFTCRSLKKAFDILTESDIEFDQLIYYRTRKFIHVSYCIEKNGKKNRKQIIVKP